MWQNYSKKCNPFEKLLNTWTWVIVNRQSTVTHSCAMQSSMTVYTWIFIFFYEQLLCNCVKLLESLPFSLKQLFFFPSYLAISSEQSTYNLSQLFLCGSICSFFFSIWLCVLLLSSCFVVNSHWLVSVSNNVWIKQRYLYIQHSRKAFYLKQSGIFEQRVFEVLCDIRAQAVSELLRFYAL